MPLSRSEQNLYHDTPIDPVSLSGVNHADVNLTGKRRVVLQFDTDDSSTNRLYFRLDESAAAPGNTYATFKPEGYLKVGGDVEFWIDPDTTEIPTLHLLLTDSSKVAANGGANDKALLSADRHNPD